MSSMQLLTSLRASAKKIYSAKLNSIDKAMKRKRRPLGRRKALNKLWDADIALRTDAALICRATPVKSL